MIFCDEQSRVTKNLDNVENSGQISLIRKFFYQEILKVIFYGNSKLKLIWRWDIGKQQFSRRKWKNTTTVVFDDHKNEACVCTKFSYSYRSNLCIRQNVKETKQQEKGLSAKQQKGHEQTFITELWGSKFYVVGIYINNKEKTFISFIFNLQN